MNSLINLPPFCSLTKKERLNMKTGCLCFLWYIRTYIRTRQMFTSTLPSLSDKKVNRIQVHKRQNSDKCDLDLKNLASSCPCCHKQYNLKFEKETNQRRVCKHRQEKWQPTYHSVAPWRGVCTGTVLSGGYTPRCLSLQHHSRTL